jgi:hypothetical protein
MTLLIMNLLIMNLLTMDIPITLTSGEIIHDDIAYNQFYF